MTPELLNPPEILYAGLFGLAPTIWAAIIGGGMSMANRAMDRSYGNKQQRTQTDEMARQRRWEAEQAQIRREQYERMWNQAIEANQGRWDSYVGARAPAAHAANQTGAQIAGLLGAPFTPSPVAQPGSPPPTSPMMPRGAPPGGAAPMGVRPPAPRVPLPAGEPVMTMEDFMALAAQTPGGGSMLPSDDILARTIMQQLVTRTDSRP